jgi:histidinol phosphatase-like PHP family hydrolase
MVLTAIELGYEKITFTDHVRENTGWLDVYIAEIFDLKRAYSMDIEINIGVEAKIKNTRGDIDFNVKYRNKVNFVLAAIHRIPAGRDEFIHGSEVNEYNIMEISKYVEEAMYNALKNPFVDVLAHPFALGAHKIWASFFSQEFCKQLRIYAIGEYKYLEYNVSKYNECVKKEYWQFPGLKVWIGSDSHSCKELIENHKKISAI